MTILGGEILRVIDKQTLFGQQVLNVYYYEVGTDLGGTTPLEIAEGWWDSIEEALRACQHEELNHVEVTVESLDGSHDFGTFTIPIGMGEGTRTGTDCMPPFASFGLKMIPQNRQVRPGSKRIAGVDEDVVDNGGVVSTGMIALLQTFADIISAPIPFVGFLDTIVPVVVGFPHPASPTGRPARLDRVAIPVTATSVSTYVTTQNTRKYGRGS